MESLTKTLDKLIEWNKNICDFTGKINKSNSDYWFILIKKPGLAIDPNRFADSFGTDGLNVYPCISYEISDELNIWGLVIDKKLNPVWIDEHKNPMNLLMEHYLGRIPLVLGDNEVPGERIIYKGLMYPMIDNPFINYPSKDNERVKLLLNAYNKFRKELIESEPEVLETY